MIHAVYSITCVILISIIAYIVWRQGEREEEMEDDLVSIRAEGKGEGYSQGYKQAVKDYAERTRELERRELELSDEWKKIQQREQVKALQNG